MCVNHKNNPPKEPEQHLCVEAGRHDIIEFSAPARVGARAEASTVSKDAAHTRERLLLDQEASLLTEQILLDPPVNSCLS